MTETVTTSQDEAKKDVPPSPSSPKSKSKVLKQSEKPRASDKGEKPPTKVVVRRLPPTMTLETFLDQVAPLPPVDYMYFVKADGSLAPNSFARAYLHFVNVSDLLIFTEKFDNYVFVDSKGNEYPAIVEYAPFQRIPKHRSSRKKDPRIGTIENDPYYQEFTEALQAEEVQRKSASKTNKQHFFETSTSLAAPKVTSTPLLEFLKARRADKLKTKEDKIAERRKREIERRKAREDARTIKHIKMPEGEGDGASAVTPQIKIAGHDRVSDSKRPLKESGVKEIASKRREEERNKVKDKERERKDRDKETRESNKDLKRDGKKDAMKDQAHDKDKDRENQPEAKTKETRRGGKSYQEERQRLNERRLATKGFAQKSSTSGEGDEKSEKGDYNTQGEGADKKLGTRKDSELTSESRSGPPEKFNKSFEHPRQQGNREGRKFEKSSKTQKDQDLRRNYDQRKSRKDSQDDKEVGKSNVSDVKAEESKSHPLKEEIRKKSYNQEREQRKAAAADRKNQNRRDSTQGNSEASADKESSKQSEGMSSSVDSAQDDKSRKKPYSGSEPSEGRKKEEFKTRGEEKDKKDPRVERRIRNKDRPSIEIYRPGMGRFSKQRLEREKVLSKESSTERDSPSSSPSPVPPAVISE